MKSIKQSLSGNITFFSADHTDLDAQDVKIINNIERKPSHRGKRRSSSAPILANCSGSREPSAESSNGKSNLIKDWINKKSIRYIRDRHSVENLDTRQLYDRVLANEENFVKGIDEFLCEQNQLNERRKEILHKKWQERVYVPLRKEVEKSIDDGFEKIGLEKRKQYWKYLHHGNEKGFVFLDVISEKEYNPFSIYKEGSPYALKARVGRLSDPLLVAERQRIKEDKVILRCDTGYVHSDKDIIARRLPPSPLVPLGRDNVTNSKWLETALYSVESSAHDRTRRRMNKKSNASDLVFTTWDECSDPKVVDREMNFQKRRSFRIPSTMPSQGVMEILPRESQVRFAISPVTSTA